MFRKLSSRTYYAHLCILLLSSSVLLQGCSKEDEPEPEELKEEQYVVTPEEVEETKDSRVIVLSTDSDDWVVQLFKEHLLYSEAVKTNLPAPWTIPTREEAKVLKKLTYSTESGERFITCDGYTFGMPSSNVSKAGATMEYSVLGLWRRKTIYDVPF